MEGTNLIINGKALLVQAASLLFSATNPQVYIQWYELDANGMPVSECIVAVLVEGVDAYNTFRALSSDQQDAQMGAFLETKYPIQTP